MLDKKIFDMGAIDIAWCPGCGNFGILNAMKMALAELDVAPEKLVIASGIGQAAKLPHYIKCNAFNGLHGRAIPPATAIKAANPSLVVIAEGGDGDMYGEGGNHFIHAIRRNPDITCGMMSPTFLDDTFRSASSFVTSTPRHCARIFWRASPAGGRRFKLR